MNAVDPNCVHIAGPGCAALGVGRVCMFMNFDTVVRGHFDPADRVLQLIKHFCVEELCFFFPREYLFLSARLQAGVLPEALQTCGWVGRGSSWQVSVRSFVEKERYLALEGEACFSLGSSGSTLSSEALI